MKQYLARQVRALNHGIEALEQARRRYSPGEYAYRHGLRADKIEGDGITGTAFIWVEEDHKKYAEFTADIQELEDLKEILTDPGATIEEDYTQETML